VRKHIIVGGLLPLMTLVLWLPTDAAAAEMPRANGVLSRDRLWAGLVEAGGTAAGIGSDAAAHYRDLREARTDLARAQTDLSFALARYDRDIAKAGLDYQVYRGASAFTKASLSLGGPPGVAAAGLISITVDKVVENAYEQRNAATLTMLQSGLRQMSQTEFEAFREQARTDEQAAAATFMRFSEEVLDRAQIASDPNVRQALATESARLTARLQMETLEATYRNARAIEDQGGSIDALAADVAQASKKIDALDAGIRELSRSLDTVANQVVDIRNEMEVDRFQSLGNATRQAAYLRAGGLAHVDPAKREALIRELDVRANREQVSEALGDTAVALDALAIFAGNVLKDYKSAKIVSDIAKGARAAQLAYTAFGYFTGSTTGIGALNALGSLSGMFGGNSDPLGGVRAELRAIQRTLVEMNRKLDAIIENQRIMMTAIQDLGASLQTLHRKVDDLDEDMKRSFSTMLQANFSGVYSGCQLLLSALSPGGGVIEFPFKDPRAYERFHFIGANRLALVGGTRGTECFAGLQTLVAQPNALDLLALTGPDGNAPTRHYVARDRDYATLRAELASRLQEQAGSDGLENALLVASQEAASIQDMRVRYAALIGRRLTDAERPCWWRKQKDNVTCAWSSAQIGGTHSSRLSGMRMADGRVLLGVADYVLSFYPQPMVDGLPANPGTMTPEAIVAHVDTARRGTPGIASRQLLENTLRLVDIATAHAALIDGNGVGHALAQDLLSPPISAGAQNTAAEQRRGALPRACLTRLGGRPAGVAAAANAALLAHPQVARVALQTVVQTLLFPDPENLSLTPRALQYALRRDADPVGGRQQFIHRTPPIDGTLSGADPRVVSWWSGVFPLAPESDRATRGYELHYAPVDGSVAQLWTAAKGNGPDSCGGYELKAVDVELPRGWSISAGGLVMALPALQDVRAGQVHQSSLLLALQDRRRALRSELASMVIAPSPDLLPAYEYALARQARDVLIPTSSTSTASGDASQETAP
jgi:hypothetical protein